MNEANEFYEDMQSRRQTNLNKQASTNGDEKASSSANASVSGNGEEGKETGATTTTDGTPSRAETDVNLTPNG